MLFRSNWRKRFPGFSATIICFDPSMDDQLDCTTPDPLLTKRSAMINASGDEVMVSRDMDKYYGFTLCKILIGN